MSKPTMSPVVPLRRSIQNLLQDKILEAVELVLEEELTAVLGSDSYARVEGRRGYRNGVIKRRVTTPLGTREVRVPRGRIHEPDGSSREHRSEILPRYARRVRQVDDAILSCYLAGVNSRRIRKALEPLLGGEHLSKSSVSRVVARLKEHFAAWTSRDLSAELYNIIYLDGFHLKVRMARRVISVPVLAVLGVNNDGQKRLVALRLAVSESGRCWGDLVNDLHRRGLPTPQLVVTDGHTGLRKAMELWPEAKIQRCTQHKRQNLMDHCPVHARPELKRDYQRIVFAEHGMAARSAYKEVLEKWQRLCPSVARSLEEGGSELLTFYEFPKALWKSIRTTNVIECINREFRRRTKTQASFSTEAAGVTLLYGLVAFGQIQFRRIDGWKAMRQLVTHEVAA